MKRAGISRQERPLDAMPVLEYSERVGEDRRYLPRPRRYMRGLR